MRQYQPNLDQDVGDLQSASIARNPMAVAFQRTLERCEEFLLRIYSDNRIHNDPSFLDRIDGMVGSQVTAHVGLGARPVTGEYKGTSQNHGQTYLNVGERKIPITSLTSMRVGGYPSSLWRGEKDHTQALVLDDGSVVTGANGGLVSDADGGVYFRVGDLRIPAERVVASPSMPRELAEEWLPGFVEIELSHLKAKG